MNTKLLKVLPLAFLVGGVVSCGGGKSSTELTVCLASEPDSIDPALNSAVDGASLLVHLDAGLMRYVKKDGKLVLENDLAKSITKKEASVEDIVITATEFRTDYHNVKADSAPKFEKDTYYKKVGDDKYELLTEEPTNWKTNYGDYYIAEEVVTHYDQEKVKYEKGVRYTIELRDDIYWTTKDGKGRKITADDFIYSWNRAAGASLAGDYCYMFEQICNGTAIETCDNVAIGGVDTLGIKKVDDTKFTVDLMVDVTFFDQLLAFPVYFPVNKDVVDDSGTNRGKWATDPATYNSCGAYKLTQWEHNSKIVLEKNPDYWDAANIVATKLTFALSDDDAAMLASFQAKEYDLIDSVPNEQIDELKAQYPDNFKVEGQMGTYYISFNMNSKKWSDKTQEEQAKIRIALAKLIDRNYIVKSITKAGQTPANAFVSSGISDADGNEFVSHNGPKGNGEGYFDKGETAETYKKNVDEAIAALKDCGYNYDENEHKFVDFPSFDYLYNTGTGHEAIGQYLKDSLKNYGITVELKNEEWASFLNTRKNGNYDVARNGWVADYDDPSSYLTMWTTVSGNNDSQFGKGAHKDVAIYSADINRDGTKENDLTWAESYDYLMDLSNKTADKNERFKILHELEDLLMETGGICPLYFYTDLYMVQSDISGFFTSPLGYKFFHFAQHKAA